MNENDEVKQKYTPPDWLETPTSQLIWTALEYAQTKPSIAVIYGGAGIGKTKTAYRYMHAHTSKYSDRSSVYIVTAHPSTCTVTSILAAIDEATGGAGDVNAYRSDHMFRSIVRRFSPHDLLIIDEAQYLKKEAIQQVRALHDEAHIGLAFMGNNPVFTDRHGRKKSADMLAPFNSRIGYRLPIPYPSREDVETFMKACGINGKKEFDFGCLIAQDQGQGLRGLCNVIDQASLFTENKGVEMNVSVLRVAAQSLNHI